MGPIVETNVMASFTSEILPIVHTISKKIDNRVNFRCLPRVVPGRYRLMLGINGQRLSCSA